MLFRQAWMLASLAVTMHGFCINAKSKLTGSSTSASASRATWPNAPGRGLNSGGSQPTLMPWDACRTQAMGGHLVVRQQQVITYTREHVLSVELLLRVLHGLSMFVDLPSATFARGRGRFAKNQNGSSTISMCKRLGGRLTKKRWTNAALMICSLWRKTLWTSWAAGLWS